MLVAVAAALVARGRRGLARFGVATVVASPTLYAHGLATLLPGALSMRPAVLWLVLGLSSGPSHFALQWLAVGIVGIALLTRSTDDLDVPETRSAGDGDLHPLGRGRRVWPDAVTGPVGQPARRDPRPSPAAARVP